MLCKKCFAPIDFNEVNELAGLCRTCFNTMACIDAENDYDYIGNLEKGFLGNDEETDEKFNDMKTAFDWLIKTKSPIELSDLIEDSYNEYDYTVERCQSLYSSCSYPSTRECLKRLLVNQLKPCLYCENILEDFLSFANDVREIEKDEMFGDEIDDNIKFNKEDEEDIYSFKRNICSRDCVYFDDKLSECKLTKWDKAINKCIDRWNDFGRITLEVYAQSAYDMCIGPSIIMDDILDEDIAFLAKQREKEENSLDEPTRSHGWDIAFEKENVINLVEKKEIKQNVTPVIKIDSRPMVNFYKRKT